MASFRFVIGNGTSVPAGVSGRRPTRFEVVKLALAALVALAAVIAFLTAAFVIGLILAVPLIAAGCVWLVTLMLRRKFRRRTHHAAGSIIDVRPSARHWTQRSDG